MDTTNLRAGWLRSVVNRSTPSPASDLKCSITRAGTSKVLDKISGADRSTECARHIEPPSLAPDTVTIRSFAPAAAEGESKYMREIYVRQRGDAAIKAGQDMVTKINNIRDPEFQAVTRGAPGGDTGPEAMEMKTYTCRRSAARIGRRRMRLPVAAK